jgi:hypothetical protein
MTNAPERCREDNAAPQQSASLKGAGKPRLVATRGEPIMPDTNVTTHADTTAVSVTSQPAATEPSKAGKPAGCGPGFERLSGLMAS